MKRNKKIIIIITSILFVILTIGIIDISVSGNDSITKTIINGMRTNDGILNGVEDDLVDALKDSGVEVIETKKICGKLSGNGNGMHFFAAALIKGEGIDIKILEKNLLDSLGEYEAVVVVTQEDSVIKSKYLERDVLTYSTNITTNDVYYTVYIFDSGIPASIWDVRGH